MEDSVSVAVNGTKKCPSLTFNKSTEDHAKLSELFESTTINLDTPLSLKTKWVIWEQIVKMPEHAHNDYKEHTKPLVSFDSVQAFWNLWFNIPQPSELATNKRLARECSDGSEHFVDAIMMFRDGIQPMWEDPLNKDGGHFDYRFRPTDVQQLMVDEYWNNIILGLVGSTIPLCDYINGVRLVDKLNSRFPVLRIEVWFKNLGEENDPTQLMKSIGTCMARKLDGSVGTVPKDIKLTEMIKNWQKNGPIQLHIQAPLESQNSQPTELILKFSDILSASSDKTVAITDFGLNHVKWVGKGHKNPINSACFITEQLLASGDDEGEIRVWDSRVKGKCVGKINEFEDCVTDLILGSKSSQLIATSGDQIGCIDHRNLKLKALSDNTEHEFLTMSLVKDGKKVICGTATGSVCFFSYGFWGDLNDIIPVNKETVNGIAKIDENLICTCGDDGEIYVVQLLPNKVLGKLQEFKSFDFKSKSTDSITINGDKSLLAFLSNFEQICVMDTSEVDKLMNNQKDDFFDDI